MIKKYWWAIVAIAAVIMYLLYKQKEKIRKLNNEYATLYKQLLGYINQVVKYREEGLSDDEILAKSAALSWGINLVTKMETQGLSKEEIADGNARWTLYNRTEDPWDKDFVNKYISEV